MSSSILIKNAKIVSSDSVILGDLLVKEGQILKIGKLINDEADLIIDAKQQYLLPGGIDPHVHFRLNTKYGYNAETFESGSLAALAGGTTTIIDFITPSSQESLEEALKNRKSDIGEIYTDYHLHQSITHWDDEVSKQMERCVEEQGIKSFKTYLAYRDSIGIDWETLEQVMRKASELGAMVLVHAEEGEHIENLTAEYKNQNISLASIHMKTHPVSTEVDAIKRVIEICDKTHCKTYIVHVSTGEGIQLLWEAKQRGLPIYIETCTQYYLMHDKIYKAKNEMSLLNILSPPLRPIKDRNTISEAIINGQVDCLSTDHCPFMKGSKLQYDLKYEDIPHGIGGVQFRNSIFHYQYIFKSLVNWQRMAELTAENPARIFGLPKKGKLEEGYDADMVLYQELPKAMRIKELTDYSKSDINVFENQKIQTKAQIVIKSGQVVYQNGEFAVNLDQGKFIEV